MNVAVIAYAVIFLYSTYCYWTWARHLRWKWRAIGFIEQQDRWRQGLCVKCGYDLRATPDRCPECGTAKAGA